jgi:signal peptidase I
MNLCDLKELTVKDLIENGIKEFEFKVTGVSMLPLFDENTKVIVKNVDPGEIKTGDIILFNSKNRIVIHRVIRRINRNGELFFKEKGDNNSFMTIVSADNVLGKVILINKQFSSRLFHPKNEPIQLKAGSFFGRFFGLIFSANDFIYKALTSTIDDFKEVYCNNSILLKSLFIPIGFSLKVYRKIFLTFGKIVYLVKKVNPSVDV